MKNVFKVIKRSEQYASFRVPKKSIWSPERIDSPLNKPAQIHCKGETYKTACLKCNPAPCVTYLDQELYLERADIPDNYSHKLCPTDAISIGDNYAPVINQDACIGCNVCVLRCPVGALYWEAGFPTPNLVVSENSPGLYEEFAGSVNEARDATESWQKNLEGCIRSWDLEPEFILEALSTFQSKVSSRKPAKDEFYPLIRNLMRTLGFKARLGRSGDTQWRFDCVTLEPFVMPMEIKSPSEEVQLSPNASRQAVENAAIIESRFKMALKPNSAVVGFQYPNKRSDVRESLVNVHESYGVSIGLYTSGVLLYLVLRNLDYAFHEMDYKFLFDNTLGACDDEALREFWANYMKWRLEIVVLGEDTPRYFDLEKNLPYNLSVDSLTGEKIAEFWKTEWSIISSLKDVLFVIK